MKWSVRAYVCALWADGFFLLAWISYRLADSAHSFNPLETGPFLVAAGVLAALLTLTTNQARSASDDFLKNATDLISKAYETLDSTKDEQGRPKNSRLVWLTSARLLCTAREVGSLITVESHKIIWTRQLEYWRGRFRDLIDPDGNDFPSEYYAERPEDMLSTTSEQRQPLAEASLAVLYRFIRWPDGHKDPLKGEKKFTDEEIENMILVGPTGLGHVLKASRKIRQQWLKPKLEKVKSPY
ncbi:hypothetical protein IPC396_00735 [Pseudomonas aeruginosa]|uniref:hypothetical protein n=1 Tax=Pseudomonas aeruginosa TaxID=287 RepID=UPI000F881DA3|nr:hypothetical protein [Pseudomonas aeruginosa]RUI51418.1 hypothetical protein IPC396_00735 [Pseudomonas aeruginosa]